MVKIRKPSENCIQQFLGKQLNSDFSYPEKGATNKPGALGNYDNDHSQILLGSGHAVYLVACEAIQNWRMFPSSWAWIAPSEAPIRTGQTLAVVARTFGVHWINACRIVYTLDGTGAERRFGFAYGTLPHHVESGEERFSVEWRADDSVWYDLKAFSHPRHWLARLAYPLARYMQRRFVKDSLQRMKLACLPANKHNELLAT